MSYINKCVLKTDLLFRKLKPSSNLIVFILHKNLYFAYTLSDVKKIISDSKQHYIEGKENLETFFYLPSGISLDSSFKDCFNRKINTLFLVKNENKFRIGFDRNKQVFNFYSVKPGLRKDIDLNEIDTFLETEINETNSDSENELDWTEIKAQQEKRLVLKNKQEEKEKEKKQTGNYTETKHFEMGVKQVLIYKNNKLKEEVWFQNDKRHRENDLPAVIYYFENGNKKGEYWYQNDIKHREGDLSAEIWYFENGNKKGEVWFRNGVFIKIKISNN